MTQKEKVLRYLKRNTTITPREALLDLNVYRLSDVVLKLRRSGHEIVTAIKDNPSTGAKYATYVLAR